MFEEVYWKICCQNLTHTFSFSVTNNIVSPNKTIFSSIYSLGVFQFKLNYWASCWHYLLLEMREMNVIFALECSFSYSALVMSHLTCLHSVLLITVGNKRCAHVKLPLASKYISGRHNVLNRKHRNISTSQSVDK